MVIKEKESVKEVKRDVKTSKQTKATSCLKHHSIEVASELVEAEY